MELERKDKRRITFFLWLVCSKCILISSGLPSRSTKVFAVIGSEFLEFTVRKYSVTSEEYLFLRENNFTEWIRIIFALLGEPVA